MKIIRFKTEKQIQYGILEDQIVYTLDGDLLGNFKKGKKLCALSEVKLLAPVSPRTIVLLAANYAKGLIAIGRELPTEPQLFFKPPSAVCGDRDNIVYPNVSKQIGFGGEIAVIMKKEATKVPEAKALEYVLGYTCSNDLMAMDIGKTDRFPTRAKGFFTFFPMGPCIATGINGDNLRISYSVNGRTTCDENTSGMIFDIKEVIAYITQFMTLEPFDVISMGSPVAEQNVSVGDLIEITVEGIGTLTNRVVTEDSLLAYVQQPPQESLSHARSTQSTRFGLAQQLGGSVAGSSPQRQRYRGGVSERGHFTLGDLGCTKWRGISHNEDHSI